MLLGVRILPPEMTGLHNSPLYSAPSFIFYLSPDLLLFLAGIAQSPEKQSSFPAGAECYVLRFPGAFWAPTSLLSRG